MIKWFSGSWLLLFLYAGSMPLWRQLFCIDWRIICLVLHYNKYQNQRNQHLCSIWIIYEFYIFIIYVSSQCNWIRLTFGEAWSGINQPAKNISFKLFIYALVHIFQASIWLMYFKIRFWIETDVTEFVNSYDPNLIFSRIFLLY